MTRRFVNSISPESSSVQDISPIANEQTPLLYTRVLNHLLWLMQMLTVFGMNVHRKTGISRICHIVYEALVILLLWFNLARYLTMFEAGEEFGSELFYKLCVMIHALCIAVCCTALIFTSRHFYTFITLWQSTAQTHDAYPNYGKGFVRMVKGWMWILIIECISTILWCVVTVSLNIENPSIVYLAIYPFGKMDLSDITTKVLYFLFTVLSVYMVCSLFTISAVGVCLTYVVYKEFTHLTIRMRRHIEHMNESAQRLEMTGECILTSLRKR